jgi:HSP20 family protein
MTNDLTTRNFWRFPTSSIPSIIEDLEGLFPTTNLVNGLSISEDDKHVYVEAAIPGLDPKEVEVTFDNGILTIHGEKKEEEKGKRYQRRATQTFLYRLDPGEVDVKVEPEANAKNGLMTVTFVKYKRDQPKKIAVTAA